MYDEDEDDETVKGLSDMGIPTLAQLFEVYWEETVSEGDFLLGPLSDRQSVSFCPVLSFVSLWDWDLVSFPVCWDVRVG